MTAPVPKLLKIGVIKGIKGNQYGGTLESSIRDRLAYDDKYEEEEEAVVERIVEYLETKNLPPGSCMFIYWPTPDEIKVHYLSPCRLLCFFTFLRSKLLCWTGSLHRNSKWINFTERVHGLDFQLKFRCFCFVDVGVNRQHYSREVRLLCCQQERCDLPSSLVHGWERNVGDYISCVGRRRCCLTGMS